MCSRGVKKLGYSPEESQLITDVLLYAQLRGNNQGVSKIATGGVPRSEDVKPLQLVKENKCGALFSGGHSMVTSIRAADKAIELASSHGVGVVASNNTHTSSGSIGFFARRVAEAGYIAFVTVANGGWAAVAPFGSAEPKLGTNPLAYAFPYDGGTIVFDTATAAAAYYGVVEAMLNGQPLPEGVGVNAKGEPTTDAAEILGKGRGAMGGALTTFAGFKGFGLSLFVQLLGSAFALAGFPGGHPEDGAGSVIIAIDPGLLAGTEEYMSRSRELVESIRSAKPIKGQTVALPGERGGCPSLTAETTGEIEIADAVWEKLLEFAE